MVDTRSLTGLKNLHIRLFCSLSWEYLDLRSRSFTPILYLSYLFIRLLCGTILQYLRSRTTTPSPHFSGPSPFRPTVTSQFIPSVLFAVGRPLLTLFWTSATHSLGSVNHPPLTRSVVFVPGYFTQTVGPTVSVNH